MRSALNKLSQLLWIVCSIMVLSRCTTSQIQQPIIPTATLFAYASIIPSQIASPIVIPQSTEISLRPSPTPFAHIVEAEDTLLGIAIRYGLNLEELLAANPGIDPRILSIDQQILIPNPEGGPAGSLLSTATPIPIALSAVACYRTGVDDLWCLAKATNDKGKAMEGIAAVISLIAEDGRVLNAKEAFGPLNLLPSGKSMPLGVLFSAPPENFSWATVAVTSSFVAEDPAERYFELEVAAESESAGGSGKTWRVNGSITLSPESPSGLNIFSLLLVALDADENVVGFRKILLESRLEPGETYTYATDVFSLGPAIEKIDILAEAIRPAEAQ